MTECYSKIDSLYTYTENEAILSLIIDKNKRYMLVIENLLTTNNVTEIHVELFKYQQHILMKKTDRYTNNDISLHDTQSLPWNGIAVSSSWRLTPSKKNSILLLLHEELNKKNHEKIIPQFFGTKGYDNFEKFHRLLRKANITAYRLV